MSAESVVGTTANGRRADHPIDPLFLERWSPRAFTGEAISPAELLTIFEAARWAPSAFNAQPWRLLFAHRDSPHWDRFFALLSDNNRVWTHRAAVLLFIVSKSVLRLRGAAHDVPSYSHSFDAGAAWAQLALQATRLGWHAHGMTGFDKHRAPAELNVPPEYRIEAAAAIGRLGSPAVLPDALREREVPSAREPLSRTVFEGGFPIK